MKLIVGLGNPGEEYERNRHNVGFIFVDSLAKELDAPFKFDKKLNAQLAKLTINSEEIIVLKPQTFMNRSGEAVNKTMGNWKLEIGDLVIVHDDLDIPLGKFKIHQGVGPKQHNGITSIEQHLKTTDFLRVRIGIDNRQGTPIPGEKYVLQNFTSPEIDILKTVFPSIITNLKRHNNISLLP